MISPARFYKRFLDWRHRKFIVGGNRFRKQRFTFFQQVLLEEDDLILDLGYGYGNFEDQMAQNKLRNKIIAVDIDTRDVGKHKNVLALIMAHAACLPFADASIDLIYCNSLLEHVGDWFVQVQVFQEIARVSRKFFVQTPNKHFPVELHHLIPFFQYLPQSFQKWIGLKILGHYEVVWLLNRNDVVYLAKSESEISIMNEKILGLTKSFVLYRD